MKNNKKILTISLALLLTACGNNTQTKTTDDGKDTKIESSVKEDKDVVAVVNGKEIPIKDYYDNLSFISYYTSAQQGMKYPIIDVLIEKEIIREDLEKNNIKLSQEEIDRAYKETVDMFGGKEKFDQMLKDYNIDDEYIKKQSEQRAMYEAHQLWYIQNNEASDEQINKYYEEHKEDLEEVNAKHILLNDEKTAKEVKEKLDNGEDWNKLAKEYSQDSYNADNGGDLGYFKRRDMDQRFSDKAFSMKTGEVSEPTESSFGWHIIKVEDIKNSPLLLKEEINTVINQEKYTEYLTELREKATIDIKDKDAKEAIEKSQQEELVDDNVKEELEQKPIEEEQVEVEEEQVEENN